MSADNLIPLRVPLPARQGTGEEQGEITAWYRKSGDHFQKGDLLYQITWPGISVEYAASNSGILHRIRKRIRDKVQPRETIGEVIGDNDAEQDE